MGFSRQEYWSGLPLPLPGDLPDPRIEPASPESPAWQAEFLPLSHLGSPVVYNETIKLALWRHNMVYAAVTRLRPSFLFFYQYKNYLFGIVFKIEFTFTKKNLRLRIWARVGRERREKNPKSMIIKSSMDFPRGPVARTLCSQCRGPGFNSWAGN